MENGELNSEKQTEYEEDDTIGLEESMLELLKQSKLTLDNLLSRLQLKESDVLNVYMSGSRVWGTATFKSDWDFVIVSKTWKGKSSIHNGDIDATIMDQEEFAQRLKEHQFLVLVCVWLPKPFVWKEELDPNTLFTLDFKKLKASIFEETDRDWRMVKKYLDKNNVERGKKTIVHSFRLLLLSIQIVSNGKVTNYQQATKYSWDLAQYYDQTKWSFFQKQYEPTFLKLRNTLSTLVEKSSVSIP